LQFTEKQLERLSKKAEKDQKLQEGKVKKVRGQRNGQFDLLVVCAFYKEN